MTGCAGGCLGRIFALVLLAILLVAAWRFGPTVVDRVGDRFTPATAEASPETADAAMERYLRLVAGETDRISFTGTELESLLRYRLAAEFPPGVKDPTIGIQGDEVRVGVRMALDLLPSLPELEEIRGMLPDTVPVEIRGLVVTLEGGRPAFIVRRIHAASIPLPRRFHPNIVQALDPLRLPGLPAEAIGLPLPPGARSVQVEGEVLVLRGH